jgi:hydroxycarboxylate dehydrogenase B
MLREMQQVLLGIDQATSLAVNLLVSTGARGDAARIVAEHLVESDRAAVPSHGVMRLPQYVEQIAAGEIDPMAMPVRERSSGAQVQVDAKRSFGQVAGSFAVEAAIDASRESQVAVVTVRRAGHAGRIGAYAERLAEAGLLAVVHCSGPRSGHWVAPFGGIDGRLSTNPIAYAFPAADGPVVADFSTSAVPEGVIRRMRALGLPAPKGALQDPAGRPTDDPDVLYSEPSGTILPLGGKRFGHKGFALGLLVEAMATLLAGDGTADDTRYGNNLAFVAIAVDPGFEARAAALAAYVRSSRPADPGHPVLMPGDPERRARDDADLVPIDATTWRALTTLALEQGVDLPTPLAR